MTNLIGQLITVDTIESFRDDLSIHAGDLPFDMWEIFDKAAFVTSPNSQIISLAKLVSTKDQRQDPAFLAGQKPDPRLTAFDRMVAAGKGFMARRAPLTVIERGDGTYHVLDGNATAQVLMLVGWKQVPVLLERTNYKR